MDTTTEKQNLVIDDFENKAEKDKFQIRSKKKRRLYLVLFAVLSALNVFLLYNYKFIGFSKDKVNGFQLVLMCVFWGFLLSLIFSMIPKKGSTFKTRYFNMSLLMAIIFCGLITLSFTLQLLTR